MTINRNPKLPIPSPLIGAESGSFTEFTVTQRMPKIARKLIDENKFTDDINQKLSNLADSLGDGYLPIMMIDEGVDYADWEQYLEPFRGKRWLDIPWFFAETYFYRLILNITGYFYSGEFKGVDPFGLQKQQGLETSLDSVNSLCLQLNNLLTQNQKDNSGNISNSISDAIAVFIYFSLWGNRVDLSLWSELESSDGQSSAGGDRSKFDIQSQESHILVNDTHQVINLLSDKVCKRIDCITDNSGFELISDLCLIDFLLTSNLVESIKVHLKPHPTFVSDATINDVHHTIDFLAGTKNGDTEDFTNRLGQHLSSGKLLLTEDYFWTSPLAFWEMPDTLKRDLGQSELVIVKGDANYRRLLGDRHWDFTTNIADILSYLPSPTLALRTLKSEVAAGIDSETIEKVTRVDSEWVTNGEWGLIELV
ncbi:MAG: damage-control phosphatase ARMT1 family protein [Mastigocoleus sp.]